VAEAIEGRAAELLDAKNFAHVSTINPDGSPLSVIAWFDTDDGFVQLNSEEGRQWVRNLHRDPRVSVLVQNSENPYEWVQFRGTVEATHEGAHEHIDALANKYTGEDFSHEPGEQRVKFRLAPEKISSYGL
jgi:PPOX class probable F420-dependent enzyme